MTAALPIEELRIIRAMTTLATVVVSQAEDGDVDHLSAARMVLEHVEVRQLELESRLEREAAPKLKAVRS